MVVPFPGTELYNMIKKEGRFITTTEDGIESGYNYPRAYYEMGDLKRLDIERYYKKAYRDFYFRPKKILQTILGINSVEEFFWMLRTGMAVIMSMITTKKR